MPLIRKSGAPTVPSDSSHALPIDLSVNEVSSHVTALHDEAHGLERTNVLKGISGHCNDVSYLPGLERANLGGDS